MIRCENCRQIVYLVQGFNGELFYVSHRGKRYC